MTVKQIAAKCQRSPSQILLRWATQQGIGNFTYYVSFNISHGKFQQLTIYLMFVTASSW